MAKMPVTVREGVGARGIWNPNYVPDKGTYWNPETGYGGQPAPPAPSVQEQRAAKVFNDALIENYDIADYLSKHPNEAYAVSDAVARLQAEGKSPEAAVKEVVTVIRNEAGFVKPADEVKWRANQHVAWLEAQRPKSYGKR